MRNAAHTRRGGVSTERSPTGFTSFSPVRSSPVTTGRLALSRYVAFTTCPPRENLPGGWAVRPLIGILADRTLDPYAGPSPAAPAGRPE